MLVARKTGNVGDPISPNGNGPRYARITRRTEVAGIIYRMIMPEVAFTGGARTACLGSPIAGVGSVLHWLFGTAETLF